jgi:hypothetical protein
MPWRAVMAMFWAFCSERGILYLGWNFDPEVVSSE